MKRSNESADDRRVVERFQNCLGQVITRYSDDTLEVGASMRSNLPGLLAFRAGQGESCVRAPGPTWSRVSEADAQAAVEAAQRERDQWVFDHPLASARQIRRRFGGR